MSGWRVAAAGALLLAACSTTTPTTPTASRTPDTPTPPSTSPSPSATTSTDPSPTLPSPGDAPPDEPSPTPTTAPAAPSPTTTDAPGIASAPPAFDATVEEVVGHPAEARMRGVSWRAGCPVGLEDLRVLALRHHDMDGGVQTGELVVHADVADDVVTAFARLYELGFPITQMRLVDDFGADDDASMRADNTSAFNCRTVAGTDRWSNHAFGTAVDVNPLRNPYVRGDRVDPPEGAAYADRSDRRPGMLHAGSPEVAAFTDLGWDWGGAWSSGQDYQHFSATGG